MNEALAVMEGKADPLSTAILSGFLTMGYARLGEFAAAEESLERGDRLAAKGDEIARLDAMLARTAIDLERGDLKEGAARAAACALRSEELGAAACGVGANLMLGVARLQVEDVIGAKVPVERGFELSLVTNMAPMRTITRGLLGAIHGRLGDLPTADIDWNDALAAARGMGDTYGEAVTLWNRGRTHARQAAPDPTAALQDFDAAATLFDKMEARPALARVLRDRAQTLGDLGRVAEADEAARRSRTLARELGLNDFS
jgi:tetratricopeptide (TPR) repeat protein